MEDGDSRIRRMIEELAGAHGLVQGKIELLDGEVRGSNVPADEILDHSPALV